MTLERIAPRPRAVQFAIDELQRQAAKIDEQREMLTGVALALKELGADTVSIVHAAHDLEHAWHHLTSQRRALVMAWPADEDERRIEASS